jgi:hypothetical protein
MKTSRFGSHIAVRNPVSRRQFLHGMGVMMALPMLDMMLPGIARAAESPVFAPDGKPRRMFAICNNLGLLPGQFFPTEAGRGYALSPYLQSLAAHRDNFTVFSGVSHPNVDGGHPADICFLTAAPHPGSGGFRNTISLDQYIAERIGNRTRLPSLTLGVNVEQGVRSLSWTASGVMIPAEERASEVFRRLFVQGSPAEVEAQMRQLDRGKSILDAVSGQAKELQRASGGRDRARLDQYFTSVRDLETRMQQAKDWERKPKPVVAMDVPKDPETPREYMAKVKLMYDMARLAFETDSTRTVSLMLDSVNSPALQFGEHGEHTTTDGYHSLSHHAKSDAKIAQLKEIDQWHMRLLSELLTDLQNVKEDGDTLLDRTMVLYGSNLGNADTHVTTNLPTIFAGGGFRHGQHLAFDKDRNYPLPNLFNSMLRRMEIDEGNFASATGTMKGLEQA